MNSNRNRYTFGLGTIGRDMLYSLISMYLIFYLSDIVNLSNSVLWWVTAIIMGARIFDALNDPIMGVIVDNTRSRFGKFKPWITIGAFASGIFTILLFTDFQLNGTAFILLFAFLYVMWGISFTANDISYWSMLPSLSTDQKERERIGAFARICANIGLFMVVAGIVPLTTAIGDATGSMKTAYFIFTLVVVAVMWIGQSITVFGVKEKKDQFKVEEKTTLRGMVRAIFKNDQLLYTAIAMALFMIGYVTTTGFGLYYFKYAFGDEGMYSIFAVILGVAQITALAVFPLFSKKFNRKKLYTGATIFVFAGYGVFFFSPMNMIFIGIAGLLLFLGQAFIQLLMLMFLADTVEYGQWKLGRRNESVTFALQPFINKMGGAIASGIVGATIIISGINEAETAADVTAGGLLTLKMAMFVLPLLFILAGYIIYRAKYKIDQKMFSQILEELKERGDIKADGE
ncbi:MAG TPA: glycoside-pentoside-hexuronide (GPH):cation symporter [Clostridia bacterium]|nr:glycoside-pentoside-hexuronide (GPH):cation symporter [Clostridia bacterium]